MVGKHILKIVLLEMIKLFQDTVSAYRHHPTALAVMIMSIQEKKCCKSKSNTMQHKTSGYESSDDKSDKVGGNVNSRDETSSNAEKKKPIARVEIL